MRKLLLNNGKLLINNESEIFSITSSEGIPIPVETLEEMRASLISSNIGKIFIYKGESNEEFINGEFYQVIEED